jgi:RNA recognition motif-containing protein
MVLSCFVTAVGVSCELLRLLCGTWVSNDSARSVFVRNLPYESTYEDLATFFLQAGEVSWQGVRLLSWGLACSWGYRLAASCNMQWFSTWGMRLWAAGVPGVVRSLLHPSNLAVFVRNLPYESTYEDLATFFRRQER